MKPSKTNEAPRTGKEVDKTMDEYVRALHKEVTERMQQAAVDLNALALRQALQTGYNLALVHMGRDPMKFPPLFNPEFMR